MNIQKKTLSIVLALMVSVSTAWGATAEEKCFAGKKTIAAKFVACRAKARNLLTARGDTTIYDRKLARCESKFTDRWAQLEGTAGAAGAACTSSGTSTRMKSKMILCMDIIDDLAGPPAPPPPSPFENNFDGTITDTKTGLMWEQKLYFEEFVSPGHHYSARMSWAGYCSVATTKRCQPTVAASAACMAGVDGDSNGCATCGGGEGTCDATETAWTWLVAMNDTNFAGHNDWRLPTVDELLSLVVPNDDGLKVDPLFNGDDCGDTCHDITDSSCACTYYGSYTTASTRPDPNQKYVYVVDFTYGFDGIIRKVYDEYAPSTAIPRAVR